MNLIRNTLMNVHKGRAYPNSWDLVALLFAFGLIALLASQARQMAVPYHLGEVIPISLDPHNLPGYALRTISRMFIALFFSLLFTFIFGTWAAKSRRAEKLIIPMIDVLQSIPILGFLSITIVGFIALFPGSLLGPECAAIFAVFTSQAWNMALGFYQTVRAVPSELREAARMFHLSSWQRFWRIDVPFSMPGLLWNTMMSMSASWFMVVASEAISVSNQQILLPGIGSYIALAVKSADMHAIFYAILTMLVVILLYDQLLFRPLVAWAEKFKSEHVSQEHEVGSWLLDLLHRTRLLRYIGFKITDLFNAFVNIRLFRSRPKIRPTEAIIFKRYDRMVGWVWNGVVTLGIMGVIGFAAYYVLASIPLKEVWHTFGLGLVTAFRVFILIILCSLIWIPVGVWAGLRPGVAQYVQPIAQFLAAFPANLLYPLVVIFIVTYHLSVNVWVTPLMILGAQWYILFNVIAAASVLPKDLLQVADNLGLNTWLRWRRLILPSIFPYYMTGAITAAGGAWNASIVAEVIQWGNTKLVATGLGAYIAEMQAAGDFIHLALGIGMMCILVLLFNRLVWRPLYVLAETRYQLD
jgi:NitT/TauT family transport system permease protein